MLAKERYAILGVGGLNISEKMLLMALSIRADDKRQCYPSQETLARDCSVSVRSVQRATKKLAERGLVKIKKIYSNGHCSGTIYTVVPPDIDDIKPDTDDVIGDIDDTIPDIDDVQNVAYVAQRNKRRINNKNDDIMGDILNPLRRSLPPPDDLTPLTRFVNVKRRDEDQGDQARAELRSIVDEYGMQACLDVARGACEARVAKKEKRTFLWANELDALMMQIRINEREKEKPDPAAPDRLRHILYREQCPGDVLWDLLGEDRCLSIAATHGVNTERPYEQYGDDKKFSFRMWIQDAPVADMPKLKNALIAAIREASGA